MNLEQRLKILEKELLEDSKMSLIHVTTKEVSETILKFGFKPKNYIGYKYYSSFGKEGIYFYKNPRLIQTYCWFLFSKVKSPLSLIYCEVPEEFVKGENNEDGYFVENENLSSVEIKRFKVLNNSQDISNLY